MPERYLLREQFADLLVKAQLAAAEYEKLFQTAADPTTKDQLQFLARGQYRHVELSERLLEIIDG